jgi:hypothetical protein
MTGNVTPFPGGPGGLPPQPPPMMPNPAYQQWLQVKQAWEAEQARRQKQFLAACDIIRDDTVASYKIDIEADSTVAADEQAEKDARIEFLKEITPFLEVVVPGLMGNPALAPLAKELGMFAVRAFPASRSLEDAFETAFDNLAAQAQKNPPQPPQQKGAPGKSPMEIQAEAQTAAGQQQTDQQVAAARAQTDQQTNMVDIMKIRSQEQIAADKLQADQLQHEQSLGLQARVAAGREALDQARISHIEATNTRGLV